MSEYADFSYDEVVSIFVGSDGVMDRKPADLSARAGDRIERVCHHGAGIGSDVCGPFADGLEPVEPGRWPASNVQICPESLGKFGRFCTFYG